MENEIMLDPEMILNKEFKVDFKGYNVVEVDHFLDQVMQDYIAFGNLMDEVESLIEDLRVQNQQLKLMAKKLAEENEVLQGNLELKQEQTVTNLDLLKRVSLLEKEVFGSK